MRSFKDDYHGDSEVKKVCNIAIHKVPPSKTALELFRMLRFDIGENVIDVRIKRNQLQQPNPEDQIGEEPILDKL